MVGLATTILLEFPLCVTLFFLFEPFCTYIVHPPSQKGTPRRVGETVLSHLLQPNPKMQTCRVAVKGPQLNESVPRWQSGAEPTPQRPKTTPPSPTHRPKSKQTNPPFSRPREPIKGLFCRTSKNTLLFFRKKWYSNSILSKSALSGLTRTGKQ